MCQYRNGALKIETVTTKNNRVANKTRQEEFLFDNYQRL